MAIVLTTQRRRYEASGILWIPVFHGTGMASFLCTWAAAQDGPVGIHVRCPSCGKALILRDRPSRTAGQTVCRLECPQGCEEGCTATSTLSSEELLAFLSEGIRQDVHQLAVSVDG